MNKAEKVICLILGAVLAWYIFSETGKAKTAAGQDAAVAATNQVSEVAAKNAAVASVRQEVTPPPEKEKASLKQQIAEAEAQLEAAKAVKPKSRVLWLLGISLGSTAAAAAVTIVVVRLLAKRKKRRAGRR